MSIAFVGVWFFLGASAGLIWLYNMSNAFTKKTLTFNDIKAYIVCLLLGFVSFGFLTVMLVADFMDNHGDDTILSWGEKKKAPKKKPLNDPWRKVDD